jgi:glycosyltransferase involved in cell wall biosynthesis
VPLPNNQQLQPTGTPAVSVVMTVYNDLRFLDEAIDSILKQDFDDFELIVVDDGTGETERFRQIEDRDPRIRVIALPINTGTAVAANRGIEAARADIIARLDADDIAEPGHIGRLVAALREEPNLGLVGSSCMLVDEAGQPIRVQPMPKSDVEIRWTILFYNPFYHSTVAYRRSCFEAAGRYKVDELISQDHYLWFQMLPLCKARNFSEPLTRYRVNPRGLSLVNAKNTRNRTHAIREALWKELGLTYDLYDDVLAIDVNRFLRGQEIADAKRRLLAYRVIAKVLRRFLSLRRFLGQALDSHDSDRLKVALLDRMLASPPRKGRETLELYALCFVIDWWTVIKSLVRRARLGIMPGFRAGRST